MPTAPADRRPGCACAAPMSSTSRRIARPPEWDRRGRGVGIAVGGSHHPHLLLLVADLGLENGAVDGEHLALGLVAGPAELKDAQAARLQLTGPSRHLVPAAPPLLLGASKDGAAESRRVASGGRGAATARQDLVSVPTVAAPTQRLNDRWR